MLLPTLFSIAFRLGIVVRQALRLSLSRALANHWDAIGWPTIVPMDTREPSQSRLLKLHFAAVRVPKIVPFVVECASASCNVQPAVRPIFMANDRWHVLRAADEVVPAVSSARPPGMAAINICAAPLPTTMRQNVSADLATLILVSFENA